MKVSLLSSILALSSLVVVSNAQQLCPDTLTVLNSEPYAALQCFFMDHADACSGCKVVDGLDITSNEILTCSSVEEQACPSIRCCEDCWEKSQNYAQCLLVELNWERNGGLVEDGCVIDCSRFPLGGAPSSVESPPTDSPIDSPSDQIPAPSDEFIRQCKDPSVIENQNCNIEKCTFCGEDGYPSLKSTQISQLKEPGSFFNCAQFEAALCPEVRCCEECSWELNQLWYQCNVVQSNVELGRADPSCTIDCSTYSPCTNSTNSNGTPGAGSGTGNGNTPSDGGQKDSTAGSGGAADDPGDSSANSVVVASGILVSWMMVGMLL